MKIYDCFTFYNEIDILKMRFDLLADHVDKFVICEADVTHSGIGKPLYFEENKALFEKWMGKIIYLKFSPDLTGLSFSKPQAFDYDNASWSIERAQRNFITTALSSMPYDSCAIISDVDEFWNPEKLSEIFYATKDNGALRMGMEFHYFYLNCKGVGPANSKWNSAFSIYSNLIKSDLDISKIRVQARLKTLQNCGWHFSYLGDVDSIIQKIESFAHQEFNNNRFKDVEKLSKCLNYGLDPYDRKDHSWAFFHVDSYPKVIGNLMRNNRNYVKDSLL